MLTSRRLTIGVPSGTQTDAFDATITFSETVSGLCTIRSIPER